MKKQSLWRKRLNYWMDNLFYSGTRGLVLWLALLSLTIILAGALVLTLTRFAPGTEAPFNFSEAFWLTLVRTLGGGSVGGRDSGWGYRLLMLAVTFGGVFIISALIGVLTTGMQARIDQLRKGRSEVMEKNHIVVLGWTGQVFSVINELVKSNMENRRECVVILGEQEKTRMEDEIHRKVGNTRRTRIVCRTGNPMEMNDLQLTSFNDARAIIVLSPESENPDADSIKAVLAVTNHPQRRKEPFSIVAVIREPRNYPVAQVVGRGEVEWIRSGDMVARIIAQTCRQSGLSVVYTGLLDYGHDEVYFYPAEKLAGKSFGDTLNLFSDDTIIGLRPAGGKPKVNPPMSSLINAGDELIVISKDNSQIAPSSAPLVLAGEIPAGAPAAEPRPEHTLILGWNWRGMRVVRELDNYVAPGSDLMVVADRAGIEEALQKGCRDLTRQKVCFRHGNTTDRELLESLDLGLYDHIVLLSYSDRMSVQQADAQTMISLLHLRDLANLHGYQYSIVSEMMDTRNRKIALVTRADDFIVSDRLVSLLMTQVASNRNVNQVFADLFEPTGSEIYLKHAAAYAPLESPVNFFTVVEAARRKNEVAIGYRIGAQAASADDFFGVVLNPEKAREVTFCKEDRVIVLAEG